MSFKHGEEFGEESRKARLTPTITRQNSQVKAFLPRSLVWWEKMEWPQEPRLQGKKGVDAVVLE